MKRILISLILAVFALTSSAQTSGGMVRRIPTQKKVQPKQRTTQRKKTNRARTTRNQGNDTPGFKEFNNGIEQIKLSNYGKAAYWLELAVKKDFVFANYFLGMLYIEGEGVEEDEDKAHELFDDALPYIYDYATNYADGESALDILDWVINMNHSPYNAWANCYKGWIYLFGKKDVQINNYKAVEYLQKGAELGSKSAMYYLGKCYENGWGVQSNNSLASKWMNKSGHNYNSVMMFSEEDEDIDPDSRGGYYQETGKHSDGSTWVYTGYYVDGKKEGLGFLAWDDGNSYYGDFKDGKYNGIGVYHYPSGNRYIGEWVDSKRNGEGTMYFYDHTYKKGNWRNNELVKVTETGNWE